MPKFTLFSRKNRQPKAPEAPAEPTEPTIYDVWEQLAAAEEAAAKESTAVVVADQMPETPEYGTQSESEPEALGVKASEEGSLVEEPAETPAEAPTEPTEVEPKQKGKKGKKGKKAKKAKMVKKVKEEKQTSPAAQPKKKRYRFPLTKSISDTYPCFSCENFIPHSERHSGDLLVCIQCTLSMYDEHTVFPPPLKCVDYIPKKGGKK